MEMIDVKLQLPQDLVKAVEAPDTQLETALWQRLVVGLYREERISFGKACELLGITKWEFADLLKEKNIPLPYDEDDLEEDLKALNEVNNNEHNHSLSNSRISHAAAGDEIAICLQFLGEIDR